MAQTQINLGVALNFDDSQYKSGVKSVEQSLKKFSTTPAFVKLKLDDTDFRKQYQVILADLQKKVQKTGALNYKTTKGKAKVADSISTIQAAYKYNLEQSQNTKLSAAEINTYKKREEVLRQYLNLLKLVGQETKRNAQLEKERANMGVRMEKARMTGKVAAERQRAYKAEFADEIEAKKADELFRRRWAHEFGQWNKKDAELARLQREADRRAKAARIQYDQKINAGTDTRTPELNDLRKFYQEQEKLANSAAKAEVEANKELERQFKNRVKAKRNAADIETAIDNEQTLRTRAQYRHFRTQGNPSIKNIKEEIKALKKLKDAEDELDRAQGKKARNKRHRSETNERIRDLERELEAAKRTAEERKKADKEATDAARRHARSRREWIKREKALMKKLGGLILRAFSVHQIIQFGEQIAKTTGYFQQQQVALEGILGSATKARSVLNDITNFALKSPYKTDELVRFTKQLSAFGIGSNDLFPTVTKLADISAGLGVDMDRIILAYGQVKSAAVLRGQELRQFTEAGIPMVEKLAKKFEELNGEIVTTADVFELISERKVSFEMVSEVLSDMTAEGGQFYKMQEELTNTLAGQISKLKDTWTLALNDMGKSGGGILNAIVRLLQNIIKDAHSVAVGIAAAFAVPTLMRAVKHFNAIVRLLRISLSLVKGVGAGIIGLVSGAIAFVITKLIGASTELKRAFEDIEISFRKETDKMIGGLYSLVKKLSKAKVGTKEFADAVETLSSNYGDFVSDEVINKLKAQDEISESLAKNFGETANNIREAIIELKKFQELEEKRDTVQDMFLKEKTETKVFRRMINNRLGTSDMTKDVFKSIYGRDARNNRELLNLWDELYDDAVTMFASGDDLSKDEFERIFTETIKETFPEIGEDELLRVVSLGWQATSQNTGAGFKNLYQSLVDSQNRIVNTDYYKLQKSFDDWTKEYKDSENYVEKQNNMEAAYVKALRDSIVDKFGESNLTKVLEGTYGFQGGKVVAANFDNDTINRIMKLLDEFESTLNDSKAKSWLAEARKLFTEGVEDKSDRAAIVSNRMENHAYLNDEVVSGLWRRYIPSNRTYKALREQIKSDYDEAKREFDSYTGNDPKDKPRKDELTKIMNALKTLASGNFYAVDLTSKKGGAKQLPPELADFLSSLKNAYQRYHESIDKGGIGIGLNYVRTNEMFQEMFGEFFGGANGEKFNALSGIKVGSQTVGELLSGKFLGGLEEGVIDFKAAALALAGDLEDTGIKSYKQAGKQLRQWVDSTISKDSLNATMNELEKTIKNLTNSFEKVNKEVDLYRKLQENGTVDALGGQLSVDAAMAATPDSVRMQGQIQTLISSLNKQLEAQNITPLSLGNLSRIDEVYDAIKNLGKITMMNNEAFDGTALGKIGGDVTNLLKQLLDTLIREAESISGEVYSGNAMQDLVANATKRLQSGQFALTSKENIARNLNTYDMAAIKTLVNATQEDAKKIFDQFMSDNRLDVIAREGNGKISDKTLEGLEDKLKNISKDFPDALRDELLSRLKDLRNKVSEYNASIGAWGSFGGAIRDYRNADKTALKKWHIENGRNIMLQSDLENAEFSGNVEEINRLKTELAASNERLKAMGENGEKLAEDLRNLSLANMQKSIQQCQEQFSSMVNSVNAVVDAAKSFANTINKVYDVMSDGENPAWMQDMESFLGDFGDAFGDMIAPMMSVISLVSTLTVAFVACEAAMTPLLIVMGVLIAVAAIVAGIIAAAQQHDRSLEHDIEDLEEQINDTQTAMKNLEATANRMVGIDKFSKQIEALSKNMKMYHDALEQARLEEEKKNTDQDKVDEYKQNAEDYLNAFKDGLKSAFEEITGSVDELSDAISSAMRSAFQNGENAARNMAAVVKENIGNIVEEIMKMNYLKPAIETAMNTLRGGSTDWFTEEFTDDEGNFDYERALDYFLKRLNNEENIENFENSMNTITTGYIDFYEALPEILKEYFSFNSDTSALSGGISGITEDTARTLEGIANSMLMQMILTNRELSTISQSGFAQVQVSWFNDMLYNTRLIADNTKEIKTMISDSMLGVKKVKVEMS